MSGWLRLTPWSILILLCGMTVLVWRQQLDQRRAQRHRHAEDVAVQAARRLEASLHAGLTGARVFARRWTTYQSRDDSRQRFEDFAGVVLAEIADCHAIALVPPSRSEVWLVSASANPGIGRLGPTHHRILDQARYRDAPVLSPPRRSDSGLHSVFAAQSLLRDGELLGFLLIEFDTDRLVEGLFDDRLRAEFHLEITDGAESLYRSFPDRATLGPAAARAVSEVVVADRRWALTVVARDPGSALAGLTRDDLAVVLFGLLLSVGVAVLLHALGRRAERYRLTRDRAVAALEARHRAEQALREAESRYHSVFDTTTDGLLIVDRHGAVIEANPAAAVMHDLAPGELAGRTLQELTAPAYRHHVDGFFRRPDRVGPVPIRLAAPERAAVEIELRGARFGSASEPRILAILTDVSERRRAAARQAQLSRSVLLAQESERARVARDLHDELGQLLTAVRFELDILRRAKAASDDCASLDNVIRLVEKAATELRRVCKGLRPPLLDDLGLGAAVQHLVDEFELRSRIATLLELDLGAGSVPIGPDQALGVYRILQESLHNISRHADASRISISLTRRADRLHLSVYDDGKGFDVDQVANTGGCGIAGMQERANLVNGALELRSIPGEGTRVDLTVPLVLAEAA